MDRHFFKPLKIHITEINNISETFKSIRTQNLVHIHYQNKKISFLKYQYIKEINSLISTIETEIIKHSN